MTNKRKIQILKKVITEFEKRQKKLEKNIYAYRTFTYYGICDYGSFRCITKSERLKYFKQYCLSDSGNSIKTTKLFRKEFQVRIPHGWQPYVWDFTVKGYQARINACKKAIERLSK